MRSTDTDNIRTLHGASDRGHVKAVKLALEKGAGVNKKDPKHITALHLACQKGWHSVVKVLLDNRADVN